MKIFITFIKSFIKEVRSKSLTIMLIRSIFVSGSTCYQKFLTPSISTNRWIGWPYTVLGTNYKANYILDYT